MSIIAGLLVNLLKGYVAKLATKEVIEWILIELGEALVKSTATPHDDKWFEVFKKVIRGEELPK